MVVPSLRVSLIAISNQRVNIFAAVPDRLPERSQAVPFEADEVCRGRPSRT